MTRKARCGSTQKHTKMPADATPWEELSREIKSTVKCRRGAPNNQTTKETIEKKDIIVKIKNESSTTNEKSGNDAFLKIEKNRNKSLFKIDKTGNEPSIKTEPSENESSATNEGIGNKPSANIEKNGNKPLIKFEESVNEPSIEIKASADESSTETENGNHSRRLEKNDYQETKFQNFGNSNINYKKKLFWEKLQQRRLENGVTLLSPQEERKIYLIKKKLRQKGMPPEVIKDIIRKRRRAAEIQYRKTVTTKICFNCREKGHLLSDCPQRLGSTNQVTGICFKCGSTEHVSYRCWKKIDGYPLAKCFICKEQGHISKECPKNKKGVYIKGGSCNVCGNINHLQKDCPTLRKKKEERIIPAYTINEGTSIDAEIIEDATVPRKKMRKQPKVVKF